MKLTNRMKVNGELAARSLSRKAKEVYDGTDPFDIYEYEVWVDENEEKRYAYTGCLGEAEGLTFAELEEFLENMADEYNCME